MEWVATVASLPILGPILRWVGAHSIGKVKGKFRDLLTQRIEIEKGVEGNVYEGYAYKPLAFNLKLDSKAFDDVSIESIDCIFFYNNVPLQRMQWNKGDKWASNCTEPQVPDKLLSLDWCPLTVFLNPVPFFSLWAELEEIDRKRLLHSHEFADPSVRPEVLSFPEARDNWGIRISVKFGSRFGDFMVYKELPRLSVKEDWKAICQKVKSIHETGWGLARQISV